MMRTAELRLRHGSTRITPSTFGPLAGFNARRGRSADRTVDDLEAAIVWIADAGPGFVWLSLDIVAVPVWLTDRITVRLAAVLGLDPSLIMVCASHTHSAPTGWVGAIHPGNPGSVDDPMVAELLAVLDDLGRRIADQRWQPIDIGLTEPLITDGGTNRHRPDGPHQSRAGVLSLAAPGGDRPTALVVDYACHPTVLGADSFGWSADWPGAMRRRLRQQIGGSTDDPTVVFLQGAAGDASTRFVRREQTPAEVNRIGELIADQLRPTAVGSAAEPSKITVSSETITVTRRSLPSADQADAELHSARDALRHLSGVPAAVRRIAETRLDGAEVQRDLVRADLPTTVPIKITVVGIGNLAWVHLPVEPFSTIADRIRSSSPFASTRVIGYTNGYLGYLVDAEAAGQQQYEAFSSLFDAAGAEAIIAACGRLLTEGL